MKIYLKKRTRSIEPRQWRNAGKKVMYGLHPYKRVIDSISIYLASDKQTAKHITCNFFIHTVHGGVVMISARGTNMYMSIIRAIKKARRSLHDIFSSFQDQMAPLVRTQPSLLPVPVKVENHYHHCPKSQVRQSEQ